MTKEQLEENGFIGKWVILRNRSGEEAGLIVNKSNLVDKDESWRFTIVITHFRHSNKGPWSKYKGPYMHTFGVDDFSTTERPPNGVIEDGEIKEFIAEYYRQLKPVKRRRKKKNEKGND